MNQPSDKINIIYDNNQTIQTIKGTTLNDILALIPQRNYAPVGAIVNNELQELDYPLYTDYWLYMNAFPIITCGLATAWQKGFSAGWKMNRRTVSLQLR